MGPFYPPAPLTITAPMHRVIIISIFWMRKQVQGGSLSVGDIMDMCPSFGDVEFI